MNLCYLLLFNNNPIESALINSMHSLGGLLGSLTFGYLSDLMGRVNALRIIAIFTLTSFIVVAYKHNLIVISISRFGFGLASGASYIVIPLFVSEITEDE